MMRPRPLHAQRFDKLAEFAQHAFARGAEHSLCSAALSCASIEARQLGQPGRRVLAQHLQQPGPCGPRQPSASASFSGRKRLVGAEMLDATANQDADAAGRHPLDQHVGEGGLADAALAGDEDGLAGAAGRRGKPAIQRLEGAFAADPPVSPGPGAARRRRFGGRRGQRRRRVVAHRRDEAIAAPRHRLDKARRPGNRRQAPAAPR